MLRSLAPPVTLLVSLAAFGCGSFGEGDASGSNGSSSGGSSGASGSGGSSGSSGTPADAAETIASGLTGARSIHATHGGVYWLSIVMQERIHRCPLDGCKGASAVFVDEGVESLTAEGNEIFWSYGGVIHSCSVGETCAQNDPQSAGASGFLLATSSRLYFSSGTNGGGVALQFCERASCSTTVKPAWSGDAIGVVDASDTDVWFTSGQPTTILRHIMPGEGAIERGDLSGLPTSIAASGNNVFFVSRNALHSCDASAKCTSTIVDTADNGIYRVRRVGNDVFYVINAAGGSPGRIKRCTLPSCGAAQVVVEGGNPRDVSVYDGWLYWADDGNERPGGSSIKRVRL